MIILLRIIDRGEFLFSYFMKKGETAKLDLELERKKFA